MRINRVDDAYGIRFYLKPLLEKIGKDFSKCELCEVAIPEAKAEIHHTKYEGATIYDLQVTCHKCNQKSENRGLE